MTSGVLIRLTGTNAEMITSSSTFMITSLITIETLCMRSISAITIKKGQTDVDSRNDAYDLVSLPDIEDHP